MTNATLNTARDPIAANDSGNSSNAKFDYSSEAELFPTRNRKFKRQSFAYRRFEQAAEAIRFAIEELPTDLLLGAYLVIDEERYDGVAIRRLYDSASYPLARRSID